MKKLHESHKWAIKIYKDNVKRIEAKIKEDALNKPDFILEVFKAIPGVKYDDFNKRFYSKKLDDFSKLSVKINQFSARFYKIFIVPFEGINRRVKVFLLPKRQSYKQQIFYMDFCEKIYNYHDYTLSFKIPEINHGLSKKQIKTIRKSLLKTLTTDNEINVNNYAIEDSYLKSMLMFR